MSRHAHAVLDLPYRQPFTAQPPRLPRRIVHAGTLGHPYDGFPADAKADIRDSTGHDRRGTRSRHIETGVGGPSA